LYAGPRTAGGPLVSCGSQRVTDTDTDTDTGTDTGTDTDTVTDTDTDKDTDTDRDTGTDAGPAEANRTDRESGPEARAPRGRSPSPARVDQPPGERPHAVEEGQRLLRLTGVDGAGAQQQPQVAFRLQGRRVGDAPVVEAVPPCASGSFGEVGGHRGGGADELVPQGPERGW